MFTRIVDGIARQQKDVRDRWLRRENDKCLAHIVGTHYSNSSTQSQQQQQQPQGTPSQPLHQNEDSSVLRPCGDRSIPTLNDLSLAERNRQNTIHNTTADNTTASPFDQGTLQTLSSSDHREDDEDNRDDNDDDDMFVLDL